MAASSKPLCWVLDERMFRQLCAGEVVHLVDAAGQGVRLVLADIGTVPMLRAVLAGTLPQPAGRRFHRAPVTPPLADVRLAALHAQRDAGEIEAGGDVAFLLGLVDRMER